MSTANELAYPGGNGGRPYADGLTKRELFAAMAMQGILASGKQMPEIHAGIRTVGEALALESIACADALIAALSKEPKP